MRKAIKYSWLIALCCLFAAYLLSCASAFLSPQTFSWSNFFSIGFPYLFAAALVAAVFQAAISRKGMFLVLFVLAAGAYNMLNLIGTGKSNFNIEKNIKDLRLLTWNVETFKSENYSGGDSSVINQYLEVIEQYLPDVICLQEYTEDFSPGSAANFFEKRLAKNGYTFKETIADSTFTENGTVPNGVGLAIYCRLPVKNKRVAAFYSGEGIRHMLSADIAYRGQMVNVNTLHLLSYQIDKHKEAFQKESTLKYTLRRLINVSKGQQRQAEEYMSFMHTKYPKIICGDFNNVPTSYIYNMVKKNMQDVFLKGASGFGITFPNFLRTLRIDFIFADKRIQVSQTKIIAASVSDHYPLVTDISLR